MDVLLIHGALGAASQLVPLQAALAGEHHVHLVELEGHGETPAVAAAYTMPGFGDNVRDFMAAKRLERAAIFGYSMGGYVALLLAAEWPERVTAIATLGTKLAWTPEAAAKEASRLDPATIRAKVPKFADQLSSRHAGAGGWENVLAKTRALMTELGRQPPIDAALLGRIPQPARLMVGDRDAVVSLDETAAAVKALPKGELVVLPNTPHPIEQVRTPLIAAQLRDFLG